MATVNSDEADRWPLGKPVNRKESPSLIPIKGRPNWFRDRNGREVYVEPPKPPQPDQTGWIQEYLNQHRTAGSEDTP